jgi:hypothetical protein
MSIEVMKKAVELLNGGYIQVADELLRDAIENPKWIGLDDRDFTAINQTALTKLQAATCAESILKEKNCARPD